MILQKRLENADLSMTWRVYAHLLDSRTAEQVRTQLPSFEDRPTLIADVGAQS
jgi:hypothetical protein